MNYLIGVTLLWSFSFSLIGVYLAGQVDAYFSVLTRIALASLVFLPFLRRRWLRPDLAAKLMALGAIQLGIMYLFYYHSFLLLTVPEVSLPPSPPSTSPCSTLCWSAASSLFICGVPCWRCSGLPSSASPA